MGGNGEQLFLVWHDRRQDDDGEVAGQGDPNVRRLADGLSLVRTDRTRSQLYHDVKRRTRPEKLLVAPLADDPKFMGMEEGALKWLRGA